MRFWDSTDNYYISMTLWDFTDNYYISITLCDSMIIII